MTRCKFKCVAVTETMGGFNYDFEVVTSGSEENDKFFHYTPYGKLSFGTTESREFNAGYEYFLDITPSRNHDGEPK